MVIYYIFHRFWKNKLELLQEIGIKKRLDILAPNKTNKMIDKNL